MNKITLIALVATAFAQEKCATAEDLRHSNFDEYKLKYKLTKDYKQGDDLTTATSIGFVDDTSKYIRTGIDTTFTIKGAPERTVGNNVVPAGFRIYSQDKLKVFSFNQASMDPGKGYYMFDRDEQYISGNYYYYTLLNYKDSDNELDYMDSDSKFYKELQVYEREKTATGTQIYRERSISVPTKFCFVKVKTSSTQCTVDKTLTDKLKNLNARFDDSSCADNQIIDAGNTCEASCKRGKKGTPVTYTCDTSNNKGVWRDPETPIDCQDFTCTKGADAGCKTCVSVDSRTKDDQCDSCNIGYSLNDGTCTLDATCKVDNFAAKLTNLHAEFEEKCKAGSVIKESNTCEASCKPPGKGARVTYTCGNDGHFKAPEGINIACKSSFVQFGVFGALVCLFALN